MIRFSNDMLSRNSAASTNTQPPRNLEEASFADSSACSCDTKVRPADYTHHNSPPLSASTMIQHCRQNQTPPYSSIPHTNTPQIHLETLKLANALKRYKSRMRTDTSTSTLSMRSKRWPRDGSRRTSVQTRSQQRDFGANFWQRQQYPALRSWWIYVRDELVESNLINSYPSWRCERALKKDS